VFAPCTYRADVFKICENFNRSEGASTVSDERYLRDMTVEDWRRRVADLRSDLIVAERQLDHAEQRALANSPLVQMVLEAARGPVK
jgi:hypothetical protein